MSESDSKWACNQCTYLNYANSIKCTMCGVKRLPHLIVEAGTDIYQLGSQVNRPNAPVSREPPVQEQEKWSCLKCTFLNFPRSQRCTQCQTPFSNISEQLSYLSLNKLKTSGITSSISSNQSLNEENRENAEASLCVCNSDKRQNLNSDVTAATTGGAGRLSPRHDSRDGSSTPHETASNYKWRCRGCTYENWPRSSKCIMCNTSKGSLPQVSQTPPARLATPPPPPPPSEVRNNQSSSTKVSPSDSSNNAVRTDNVNSDKESRQAENNAKNCENINEKNKSRSESAESIACIRSNSGQTNSPAIASAGATNVSPLSSPQQQQQQLLQSMPQAVSLRAVEGAMALNNYETEKLLRQLRRRLREADWVWLNACLGVVEGNYEPVEAYLSSGAFIFCLLTTASMDLLYSNSYFNEILSLLFYILLINYELTGGDPMRQLTNADVKLLARPSAFDEGHTLVHLAIR